MLKAAEGSLARRARGAERLTMPMLALALALLGLGVTLPVVKVSKLFLFTDHVSILEGIAVLMNGGDVFLAAVVTAFSVLFPVLKILAASHVWRGCAAADPKAARALAVLGFVGRWSMLDVLVVALIVFSVKASSVANAAVEPGLYCFAGAVVASASALALIKRAAAREARERAAPAAQPVDYAPAMN